ncbi:hypothetical protein SAMN06265795_108169 [Noviherbaspirillum humi]|uniref:Uncharacterized protein n=1 Tax=Noviherbaspirillum humi TaxID=1688639 RepID=A0A239I753_9BURK|nr:hypothetical protein SAMN06265795_108169 [Noviherbaspirillum humi]
MLGDFCHRRLFTHGTRRFIILRSSMPEIMASMRQTSPL